MIGHAVSGGSYDSVTVDSVSVFELDNDGGVNSNGVILLVDNQYVLESVSATTITVTTLLDGDALDFDTPVVVSVGAGASTATSGTDFATVSDFTVTIAAGTLSQTATFILTLNSDDMDEMHETVAVTGTTTVPAFSVTGTAVNILDDDFAPSVTLVLTPESIKESNDGFSVSVPENRAVVTATLNRASSEATTVTVSVLPDAPAVTGDYSLSANKELTIAAGSKSSTGTVTITAVDNVLDTADKTVAVKGSATNTLGIIGPADRALTIVDDDGIEPTNNSASTGVLLSVDESSLEESASATTITRRADAVDDGDERGRGRDGERCADFYAGQLVERADGDGEGGRRWCWDGWIENERGGRRRVRLEGTTSSPRGETSPPRREYCCRRTSKKSWSPPAPPRSR